MIFLTFTLSILSPISLVGDRVSSCVGLSCPLRLTHNTPPVLFEEGEWESDWVGLFLPANPQLNGLSANSKLP